MTGSIAAQMLVLGRQDAAHAKGKAADHTFFTAYEEDWKGDQSMGYSFQSWKDHDEFLKMYHKTKAPKRWYEQNTGKCVLYFDIEGTPEDPEFKGLTPQQIVDNMTETLKAFMASASSWDLHDVRSVVPYASSACSETKISYHITYRMELEDGDDEFFYFPDVRYAKEFTEDFHAFVKTEGYNVKWDRAVYTKNRNFRLLGSHKYKNPQRVLRRLEEGDERLFMLSYVPSDHVNEITKEGWAPVRKECTPGSPSNSDEQMRILECWVEDNFLINETADGRIRLDRLKPTYCERCMKIHHTDNYSAYFAPDGRVFVKCFQHEKSLYIGGGKKIEVAQVDPSEVEPQEQGRFRVSTEVIPEVPFAIPDSFYHLIYQGDAGLAEITAQVYHHLGVVIDGKDGYRWNKRTLLYEPRQADGFRRDIVEYVVPVLEQMLGNSITSSTEGTVIDDLKKLYKKLISYCRGTTAQGAIWKQAKESPLLTNPEMLKAIIEGRSEELPLKDGMLINFKTKTIRKRHKGDYYSHELKVSYKQSGRENALKFFSAIACKKDRTLDEELLHYEHVLFGLFLTGDVNQRQWWIFHGDGMNGKGALFTVVNAILGEKYYTEPAGEVITKGTRSKGSASPDLANIEGKRVVKVDELPSTAQLDCEFVKKYTSGDPIEVRPLYQKGHTMMPVGSLVLCVQRQPQILFDKAMGDRTISIPFYASFKKTDEENKAVENSKTIHLDEMFSYMADGASMYYENNRRLPPTPVIALEDIEEYKQAEDVIGTFLTEVMETGDFLQAECSLVTAVHQAFNRAHPNMYSLKAFNDELLKRGYVKKVIKRGTIWEGSRIRPL